MSFLNSPIAGGSKAAQSQDFNTSVRPWILYFGFRFSDFLRTSGFGLRTFPHAH